MYDCSVGHEQSVFTYSNFNMQNEWTLPHGVEGGIRGIDDRFIIAIKPSDGSGVRSAVLSCFNCYCVLCCVHLNVQDKHLVTAC